MKSLLLCLGLALTTVMVIIPPPLSFVSNFRWLCRATVNSLRTDSATCRCAFTVNTDTASETSLTQWAVAHMVSEGRALHLIMIPQLAEGKVPLTSSSTTEPSTPSHGNPSSSVQSLVSSTTTTLSASASTPWLTPWTSMTTSLLMPTFWSLKATSTIFLFMSPLASQATSPPSLSKYYLVLDNKRDSNYRLCNANRLMDMAGQFANLDPSYISETLTRQIMVSLG